MLTRRNIYTGIEYRDDPTIFAWELINEPRCMTDPSGDTLQVTSALDLISIFECLNKRAVYHLVRMLSGLSSNNWFFVGPMSAVQ